MDLGVCPALEACLADLEACLEVCQVVLECKEECLVVLAQG